MKGYPQKKKIYEGLESKSLSLKIATPTTFSKHIQIFEVEMTK